MRAGSGAVLLVGFALVVMLLSVAGTVTPPSIGIKQDPSQDFTDIASAMNEIAKTCNSFRGDDSEKYYYMDSVLKTMKNEMKVKGISIDNILPSAAGGRCFIVYTLRSWDNSSYFTGVACEPKESQLCKAWRDYLSGASLEELSQMVIIPPGLCFSGGNNKVDSTHFLIGNPNPVRIHIILAYSGNDELQKLQVQFPGQGEGTIQANNGVVEFYLDPMTNPTGRGVALGQRTMADAFINIRHTSGQSGLVDKITLTVPEYNFVQEIPIYWNTCPVVSWGQVISSLRG
jgi:hypothetical protein